MRLNLFSQRREELTQGTGRSVGDDVSRFGAPSSILRLPNQHSRIAVALAATMPTLFASKPNKPKLEYQVQLVSDVPEEGGTRQRYVDQAVDIIKTNPHSFDRNTFTDEVIKVYAKAMMRGKSKTMTSAFVATNNNDDVIGVMLPANIHKGALRAGDTRAKIVNQMLEKGLFPFKVDDNFDPKNIWYVGGLGVKEGFRGYGIAKKLSIEGMRYCKNQHGVKFLAAGHHLKNRISEKMQDKFGYLPKRRTYIKGGLIYPYHPDSVYRDDSGRYRCVRVCDLQSDIVKDLLAKQPVYE